MRRSKRIRRAIARRGLRRNSIARRGRRRARRARRALLSRGGYLY